MTSALVYGWFMMKKSNVVMETTYENGVSSGMLRNFYPGKKLKSEGEIRDNVRVGRWTSITSTAN
jgi:antitoxin component YwqK of YwqJK toxin-antitoxin module